MNASRGDEIVSQLENLLKSIEASGRAILPRTNDDLLRLIVEAAVRIFAAAGASIALINEREQTLEFKVSYNQGDFDVVGMSIPMDKGIAGYVAMTGQPLAVSNVQQDPRFDRKFAESTGYVPDSILATPLLSGDRVIGVMEVLDKLDAASFGIQEMELLGMLSNIAAVVVAQSQQTQSLTNAFIFGLKRLAGEERAESQLLSEQLDKVMENLQFGEAPEGDDLLVLADVFREISELGSAERKACLQVLRVFVEYNQSKRKYSR